MLDGTIVLSRFFSSLSFLTWEDQTTSWFGIQSTFMFRRPSLRGSLRGRTCSVSLSVLFEVISGLLYLCKAGILTKLQTSELSMEANSARWGGFSAYNHENRSFGTLVGYRVLVLDMEPWKFKQQTKEERVNLNWFSSSDFHVLVSNLFHIYILPN
jgi:hypothetical protein